MDILNVRSSEIMKKAMDGLSNRNDAINGNLANVDTPGYKPVRVEFEDKLRRALEKEESLSNQTENMNKRNLKFNYGMLDLNITNQKHLGGTPTLAGNVSINAYKDDDISYRVDDNGVDIDTEMTNLAKNTMQYQALATLQSKHFTLMKDIIKSGGG
ncbi:MAG: flagellar basal body rod protein FlgB [Vampirovibrionia bacterium]